MSSRVSSKFSTHTLWMSSLVLFEVTFLTTSQLRWDVVLRFTFRDFLNLLPLLRSSHQISFKIYWVEKNEGIWHYDYFNFVLKQDTPFWKSRPRRQHMFWTSSYPMSQTNWLSYQNCSSKLFNGKKFSWEKWLWNAKYWGWKCRQEHLWSLYTNAMPR
jgi:hypothetical protein